MVPSFFDIHFESFHGNRIRHATCEFCECEFVYAIQRESSDAARDFLTVTQSAKLTARFRAEKKLEQRLDSDVEITPCPRCGCLQPDMVEELRRRKYFWMTLARWAGFIASLCMIAIFVIRPFDPADLSAVEMAVVAALVFGGPLFGVLIWRWQDWRRRTFDPNADPLANLAAAANTSAITRAEFDRVGVNRLLEPLDQTRARKTWGLIAFDYSMTVIPWFLFAVAVSCGLIYLAPDFWNSYRSQYWPTAMATLKSATFERRADEFGKPTIRYYLQMEYVFKIQETDYTGTQYHFDRNQSRSKNLFEILELIGSLYAEPSLVVHYNPRDPSQSVVVAGFSGQLFAVLCVMVVLLVGLVSYGVISHRKFMRDYERVIDEIR